MDDKVKVRWEPAVPSCEEDVVAEYLFEQVWQSLTARERNYVRRLNDDGENRQLSRQIRRHYRKQLRRVFHRS